MERELPREAYLATFSMLRPVERAGRMRYPSAMESPASPIVDADPDSFAAPAQYRARRRFLIFAGVGVAAYLLALLVTIPARLFVPLPDVIGTIWHGEAPLGGGNRVAWHWAPLSSLFRFGFAADFSVTGVETSLAGKALLHPGGQLILGDVSGSADGALIDATARPAFACSVRMQIHIKRLSLGGGERGGQGRIDGEPGVCQAFGGTPPVSIPALRLDLTQSPGVAMINLAPRGHARKPWLVGGLSENGQLSLIVTAEGATAMPFASTPGGMKVETEF